MEHSHQKKDTHPTLYAFANFLFNHGWIQQILRTFAIFLIVGTIPFGVMYVLDINHSWLAFVFTTIIPLTMSTDSVASQTEQMLTIAGERVTKFIPKKNDIGMFEYDSHGHIEGTHARIMIEEGGRYFMWWGFFSFLEGTHGEEVISTESFPLESGILENVELNDGIIIEAISVIGTARITDSSLAIEADQKVLQINTQKTLFTQLRSRLERRGYKKQSEAGVEPLHGNLDAFLKEVSEDPELVKQLADVGYRLEDTLRLGEYRLSETYLKAKEQRAVQELLNQGKQAEAQGLKIAYGIINGIEGLSEREKFEMILLITGNPEKNSIFWNQMGTTDDPGGLLKAKVLEAKGML